MTSPQTLEGNAGSDNDVERIDAGVDGNPYAYVGNLEAGSRQAAALRSEQQQQPIGTRGGGSKFVE